MRGSSDSYGLRLKDCVDVDGFRLLEEKKCRTGRMLTNDSLSLALKPL